MKARLLVGLLTVALGGLTSCGNILEENGVINNVAESGMGELRINLLQDETVIVDTKAIKDAGDDFMISVKPAEGEATQYTYSTIKGKAITLNQGSYTVSAYNKDKSAVNDFEWNAPYYTTEQDENVTITAKGSTSLKLTCTLANSTLKVDTSEFLAADNSSKILYVESLVAKNNSNNSSTINLLEENKSWNKDSVFVKAGIPATIELIAVRITDGKKIPVSTPLKKVSETDNTPRNIDAKTKYQVNYTANSGNGGLTITVEVNDEVSTIKVPVNVDPYPTQETQSSGSGE